jgi:hypothetical protein
MFHLSAEISDFNVYDFHVYQLGSQKKGIILARDHVENTILGMSKMPSSKFLVCIGYDKNHHCLYKIIYLLYQI